MYRPIGRYLIITFIVLLLFIFIVVKLFGGGGNNPEPKPNPPTPTVKPLPDYSDTMAEVSMTIDGSINGTDQHRAIKVTVDRFSRKLDIIGGYSGNILQEKTFSNNEDAYDIFLRALNNSGFMAKRKNPSTSDERGQCPLGNRFIFELNDSGDVLSHLWSSSCGTGTLGGSTSTLQELFQAQITNYDRLTSNVNL